MASQSAILSHELTENIQATEPDRFVPPLRELAAQLVEEGNRGDKECPTLVKPIVRRWGSSPGYRTLLL